MALAAKGQTTKYTLTATPQQIAAAKSPNEDRKSIVIINRDPTNTIEFAFKVGTLSANFPTGAGIPIPAGGSYIEGDYDQQRVNNGDVWAAVVAPGVSAVISYTEN